MKYIVFLILIIACIVLFFYSDKKIASLRNQMVALKKQNSNLSQTLSALNKKEISFKNINLIPNTVSALGGIIKKSSEVYIGPLNTLPIIYTTDVNMEVKIFDKVQNNDEFWYYVELPKDSPINSRGWIEEKQFVSFNSSSGSVVKYY